ncbi:hypothetical protein ACC679_38730, partial [Rhizobium ruizarguesonis]
ETRKERIATATSSERHAQKILNEMLNKTDANDADGLAARSSNRISLRERLIRLPSLMTWRDKRHLA